MSQVELTRPNTDCVNVQIEQTGKSESVARFKLPFLLPQTDYVVGLTSLTIPIMNTQLTSNAYPELFEIFRRNVGQDITNAPMVETDGRGIIAGLVDATATPPQTGQLDALHVVGGQQVPVAGSTLDLMRHGSVATFSLTAGNPLLNVSDFLMRLNIFSAAFTNRIARCGIDSRYYGGPSDNTVIPDGALNQGRDPDPDGIRDTPNMINFGITPSGFLIITLEPLFNNHFFINISPKGKALLGITADQIAITQNQTTGVLSRYGEGLLGGAGGVIIQPATVSVAVSIFAAKSLLQTLPSRISVHVETDLPILKTITTSNGVEGSSYDLASFVLENESSSRIYIEGLKVLNDMEFITATHSGQLVLQSRNENPTQWSPLLSVDELLIFRVRLYLKTREYDPITNKWIFEKKRFPITEDSRWSVGLRFVSME